MFRRGSVYLCALLVVLLTSQPSSCQQELVNTTEGNDLVLSLPINDGPLVDATVTWTICCPNLQILNNSKFLLTEDDLSVSLTINDITGEDSAVYTVTVVNDSILIDSKSFQVQVQIFPVFLEQPQSVASLVQDVVQLVCTARGDPLPSIAWYRNDGELVLDSEETISIIDRLGESVSLSILTFESLSIDVAGMYYCNATNDLVTVASLLSDIANEHRYFKSINWNKLIKKEIEPPFKIIVRGDEDVSQFDTRFTKLPAVDSPVDTKISASADLNFKGFTYVAESFLEDLYRSSTNCSPTPNSFKNRIRSPRKPLGSPLRPVTTESKLVFGFDAPHSSLTYTNSKDSSDHHHPHGFDQPITIANGTVTTSRINGGFKPFHNLQPSEAINIDSFHSPSHPNKVPAPSIVRPGHLRLS